MSEKKQLTIQEMIDSGVHFGHLTSRWNPKMKPYIHSKSGGRYLIDVSQTIQALESIYPLVVEAVSRGRQVLFIGTKLQSKDILKKTAVELDMPYVVERWMGGLLTNYKVVNQQINYLKGLEQKLESGELASRYNKLEVLKTTKHIERLNKIYGGIKNMTGRPAFVFIADMIHNSIAVTEANKLKIPIIAIADTNVNPKLATHLIPANDDAIKSVQTIVDFIASAIVQGVKQRQQAKVETKPEEKPNEG